MNNSGKCIKSVHFECKIIFIIYIHAVSLLQRLLVLTCADPEKSVKDIHTRISKETYCCL